RTAHQQRDYREACRALYMAALQRLNDAHSIPKKQAALMANTSILYKRLDLLTPIKC
ncbi:MAG: hypothetical protein HC865_15930, partial [Cyanobacteria bacterium RU_5_0]|nr:hypothetical protein [Cyanobacteria bacterium RU_5_0]